MTDSPLTIRANVAISDAHAARGDLRDTLERLHAVRQNLRFAILESASGREEARAFREHQTVIEAVDADRRAANLRRALVPLLWPYGLAN